MLITTGSQQGLDLVAKVLIDAGSRVAVETPTYLGALQAFTPYEPNFVSIDCDDDGPLPHRWPRWRTRAPGTRFAYLLPNFQNPTGRVIPRERARGAGAGGAQRRACRWSKTTRTATCGSTSRRRRRCRRAGPKAAIYLGSFSKVLAPGLRLGYLVAPPELAPKLLQAKQAADLHTPGFNQRVVYEVMRDGFLDQHVPTIRARYQRAARRDGRRAAPPHAGRHHVAVRRSGGMFFWAAPARGARRDAAAASRRSQPAWPTCRARRSIAHTPDARTLRLSFVTLSPADIAEGVAALGRVLQRGACRAGGADAVMLPFAPRSGVRAAAAIVHARIAPTPQHRWPLLDERCGAQVFVKHENHTPVGAFKVRGGIVYFDRLMARGDAIRRRDQRHARQPRAVGRAAPRVTTACRRRSSCRTATAARRTPRCAPKAPS